MNLGSGLSSTQINTAVWSTGVRSITLFDGALTNNGAAQASLAASASVNPLVGPGTYIQTTCMAFTAGAAGSCQMGMWDGTNFKPVFTAAAGATSGGVLYSGPGSSARLTNNDGANAATYMYVAGSFRSV